ncbi:MAG: MoaD/ThiS family protein [Vicingus serpentipes]|nr:MoaD/ThiS family protein [Vicingus serpentipes]
MILRLKYFGMIAEAIAKEEENVEIQHRTIADLDGLLKRKYPQLVTLEYQFALNQTLAGMDEIIKDGDEIALLPPFAGG